MWWTDTSVPTIPWQSVVSLSAGRAYYWKLKTSHHSAINHVVFSLVYENVRWKYLPFIRYHTPINPMMCRPLPLAKYNLHVGPYMSPDRSTWALTCHQTGPRGPLYVTRHIHVGPYMSPDRSTWALTCHQTSICHQPGPCGDWQH